MELGILNGEFRRRALDESLLLDLHQRICRSLVPAIAGRFRGVNVQVGQHVAPPFHEVPMSMRDYCRDLQARFAGLEGPDRADAMVELLAFAEGRLLSIHPFEDFNGRLARVFLAELLQRLNLPGVTLTPDTENEKEEYLAALRAGDRHDLEPLTAIWRRRFEKGTEV